MGQDQFLGDRCNSQEYFQVAGSKDTDADGQGRKWGLQGACKHTTLGVALLNTQ